MAKLQKQARAQVSCRGALPPLEERVAEGWGERGHFHLARLRGRRPRVSYSADLLWNKRNTILSFLRSLIGTRMRLTSTRGEVAPFSSYALTWWWGRGDAERGESCGYGLWLRNTCYWREWKWWTAVSILMNANRVRCSSTTGIHNTGLKCHKTTFWLMLRNHFRYSVRQNFKLIAANWRHVVI